jgi:ClpP class serine protease
MNAAARFRVRPRHVYDPQLIHGSNKPLAVDPQAFFSLFMMPETRENTELGNVTIVDISGPLHTHDSGWCDSYESILERVQQACESAAQAIVLRIDSPGGEVGGCYDAARKVRALGKVSGKPIYAFVEESACSAAYALASAANVVVLSDSGIVGSIGVLSTRSDYSAGNMARGLRVALITSGARKADGNPDAPITDSELKATQEIVDSMANEFFALVAELRGIDAAAVKALEAKRFHGATAVTAGLADRVQSFDNLIASIAAGESEQVMASDYDTARTALEKVAKGNDANAEAAKRALAAMEPPKPDGDGDSAEGDEPPADDDKKPKPKDGDAAESEPPADDDKEASAAQAAAAGQPLAARSAEDIALEAMAKVHKLEAAIAQERIDTERKALLDARPDLAPELRALLMTTPIKKVREYLKELPKGQARTTSVVTPTPTRGATQGGPAHGSVLEASAIDRAMGLTSQEVGVRLEGSTQVFGFRDVEIKTPAAQPAAAGGNAK